MPEIVEVLTAAGVLFTAAGVLLNTWLLIKLNGKFDRLEFSRARSGVSPPVG